jgi:uncharacterized HAD superfamily protein
MSTLYGIDLDGVCFDFMHAFCKWLEDKTGVEMPKDEEITSYYWHEVVDGLEEDSFWREFHKFGRAKGYAYLNLLPGAKEALESIVDAGNEIVYITNRPDYAYFDTELSLQYHLFPFRGNLVFANGHKSPVINELGVDVFIDDSPSTIKEITTHTKARIYCRDCPYNRKTLGDVTRYTRVHSWEEFLEYEQITSRFQGI